LLAGATCPIVCPLLERGACLVYEVRPVACRMYGFYVDRDGGQFCDIIEALHADVVWGNAAAVDAELSACGDRRDLLTRWRERSSASAPAR
jgi:uncharacterized protein